jgi:hypothetical protein
MTMTESTQEEIELADAYFAEVRCTCLDDIVPLVKPYLHPRSETDLRSELETLSYLALLALAVALRKAEIKE